MNRVNRAWAEKAQIRLDLTDQGAAGAALVDGWSTPETYGSWAIGHESQLRIPIPSDRGDVWVRLTLRPFTAAHTLVSQRLQIGMDGQVLGHYELADWSDIECRVPSGLTRGRTEVTLRLFHPYAASPFSQGLSDDVRLLAFMLRTIEISSGEADVRDESAAIVFEGDSLSRGVSAELQTSFRNSGAVISNHSVSGATLRERLGSYDSDVSTRYSSGASAKLIHLGAGSNDIRSADDPASIYDELKTLVRQFCAKARDDGFTVVVATVLPRIDISDDREAARVDFNNFLRSEWPAFADGLADWASDPVLGSSHFPANHVFCADGIHPTQMGYRRLGEISKVAIEIAMRSAHSTPRGEPHATLPGATDGSGQMMGNLVAVDTGLAGHGGQADVVTIDFGPEGNFSQFQSGGFSGQEVSGIWSLGDESWIIVPIGSGTGRLLLRVWVQPCLIAGLNASQGLTVQVGDSVVGSYECSSSDWVHLTYDLTDAVAGGAGMVRVTFRHPSAVAPVQSGQSSDVRRLAFMFKDLSVFWFEESYGPVASSGESMIEEKSADVHEGVDGWLFLVGGSNDVRRYYNDAAYFTDSHSANWCQLLIARNERLLRSGVQYLHIIAPDKISVYPDYFGAPLPNFRRHPSRLVRERLESVGCGGLLVDPLHAFSQSHNRDRLYLKTDTHWTYRAGQIVLELVAERLGSPRRLDLTSRSLTYYEMVWDLGSKVKPHIHEQNFAVKTKPTVRRVYANQRALDFEENVRLGKPVSHGSIYTKFENTAPTAIDKVLVIFGDSFMDFQDSNTTTIFAENFREVHFVWSPSIDYDFVERVGAQVVITELAERFMVELPRDSYSVVL